jgi:hypothetical protein
VQFSVSTIGATGSIGSANPPPPTSKLGVLSSWSRSDITYDVCVHDDKPDRDSVLKLGVDGSSPLATPVSDFDDVESIASA